MINALEIDNLKNEVYSHLPDNYIPSGVTVVPTACDYVKLELLVANSFIGFKPIPIFTVEISNKLYKFNSPIYVQSTFENNLFITSNNTLNLYGTGDTLEDAIRDLCESIIFVYEDYLATDDSKLTPKALEEKLFYKSLILQVN